MRVDGVAARPPDDGGPPISGATRVVRVVIRRVGVITVAVRPVIAAVVTQSEAEAPAVIGPAAATEGPRVPAVAEVVIVVDVDGTAGVVIVVVVGGGAAVHPITRDDIVETTRARQGLYQIGERRLGVVRPPVDRQPAVIPAIGQHHVVEAPGVAGDGGEDQSGSVLPGAEGALASLVAHLVAAPS